VLVGFGPSPRSAVAMLNWKCQAPGGGAVRWKDGSITIRTGSITTGRPGFARSSSPAMEPPPQRLGVTHWSSRVSGLISSPRGCAHSVGCFLGESGHHVAVDVRGCAHLAVAEQLHDDARVDAGG
jgi:hypothetical protein